MPNPATHSSNLTYVSNNSYWNTAEIWQEFMSRYNRERPEHRLYLFVAFTGSFPADKMLEEFPYVQLDNCIDRFRKGTVKRKIVVLLDGHTEGVGWKHVEPIADKLITEKGLSPTQVIHWTGSRKIDVPVQMVQTLSALALVTDHTKVMVINEPTHHFVMLARVPRKHRVMTAIELIARDLGRYGYHSCGSGNYGPLDLSVFDIVPAGMRHLFPLSIDSQHVGTDESRSSGMLSEVSGAFCQLIPESSHDILDYGWVDPFPTEKTAKCFLLKQAPIWICPPLYVQNMREIGFDVFDDLIDHSYDIEPDPIKRIHAAIDQLQRICDTPLDDLVAYKQANDARFERNRTLCMRLRDEFMPMHYEKFKACMDLNMGYDQG